MYRHKNIIFALHWMAKIIIIQGSHYILVLKFKDFSTIFKDPEVAFSRTDSRWKFTAWTVLQQYLILVSVITGQF